MQGRNLNAAGANPREIVFSENVMPEVITTGNLNLPFVLGQGVGGMRRPDAKMARTRRWELNYDPGEGGEWCDLEQDPGETRKLYRAPAR